MEYDRNNIEEYIVSRSQLKAKFIDFLDENRIIFVVLSCRFKKLDRGFGFFVLT